MCPELLCRVYTILATKMQIRSCYYSDNGIMIINLIPLFTGLNLKPFPCSIKAPYQATVHLRPLPTLLHSVLPPVLQWKLLPPAGWAPVLQWKLLPTHLVKPKDFPLRHSNFASWASWLCPSFRFSLKGQFLPWSKTMPRPKLGATLAPFSHSALLLDWSQLLL